MINEGSFKMGVPMIVGGGWWWEIRLPYDAEGSCMMVVLDVPF